MNASLALVIGAVLGVVAGSLLVPLTRRELAAAIVRSGSPGEEAPVAVGGHGQPRIAREHWATLALVSGLLPAYLLHRVGWTPNVLPLLLLLVGLVQLAYCDLVRRLIPKTLVYALSVAVIGSGVIVAVSSSEWGRLVQASLGGIAAFALFFLINMMNPRWMAFGDVRLSLVFGFGLAWVSPLDLFEAFFYANLLAVVVGVGLMAARRADRKSALPFGVFMALGAALVLFT